MGHDVLKKSGHSQISVIKYDLVLCHLGLGITYSRVNDTVVGMVGVGGGQYLQCTNSNTSVGSEAATKE